MVDIRSLKIGDVVWVSSPAGMFNLVSGNRTFDSVKCRVSKFSQEKWPKSVHVEPCDGRVIGGQSDFLIHGGFLFATESEANDFKVNELKSEVQRLETEISESKAKIDIYNNAVAELLTPKTGSTAIISHFWHQDDLDAPSTNFTWPYVYLHGKAEELSGSMVQNLTNVGADDIFVSDRPMPTVPGEYTAILYGRTVIVVIAYSTGFSKFLKGRAALHDDPVALAHARRPEDWR